VLAIGLRSHPRFESFVVCQHCFVVNLNAVSLVLEVRGERRRAGIHC
jgi:hypothetical protein